MAKNECTVKIIVDTRGLQGVIASAIEEANQLKSDVEKMVQSAGSLSG